MRKLLLGSLCACLLTGCYTVLRHPEMPQDSESRQLEAVSVSDGNRCASCHGAGSWWPDPYPAPWPRYVHDDPWWLKHRTGQEHQQGESMTERRFPGEARDPRTIGVSPPVPAPPVLRAPETPTEEPKKRPAEPAELPRREQRPGASIRNPRPRQGQPAESPRPPAGKDSTSSSPRPPAQSQNESESQQDQSPSPTESETPAQKPPTDPAPPAAASPSSQGQGMSNDRGGRPRP